MATPSCPSCAQEMSYFSLLLYNPWRFNCKGCQQPIKCSGHYRYFLILVFLIAVFLGAFCAHMESESLWTSRSSVLFMLQYVVVASLAGWLVWQRTTLLSTSQHSDE